MQIPQEWIDNNCLERYAWPGGYPIFYLDSENSIMCSDCATRALVDPETPEEWKPILADVNYEDPDLYCEDCSQRIESAYCD